MSSPIITPYSYIQSTPSTTWTINHNLGSKPMVDVLLEINGVMQKVYPLSITHTSDNTVVVTWSLARTGRAVLTTSA